MDIKGKRVIEIDIDKKEQIQEMKGIKKEMDEFKQIYEEIRYDRERK